MTFRHVCGCQDEAISMGRLLWEERLNTVVNYYAKNMLQTAIIDNQHISDATPPYTRCEIHYKDMQ